jgi:hypothetical protein
VTDRDKLIEAMARGLCKSEWPSGTERDYDMMWEGWVTDAQAALAAIEANGFAVVPREPTVKMVAAGFHEYVLRPSGTDGMELIDYCYRAMIAAAPMQGGKG